MSPSAPTPYENFLYHLNEIEFIVDRGMIDWPVDQVDAIRRRLAQIMLRVSATTDRTCRPS